VSRGGADRRRGSETDLGRLLAGMRPELRGGTYLFCTVAPESLPTGLVPLATFRESEGVTLVVEKGDAGRHGLAGEFEAAWIELTVHSDLAAVGFLAAIATALAEAGIPCNAIAAFHHDHLFVPKAMAGRAMAALELLQRA
jgi:hypothetical protein